MSRAGEIEKLLKLPAVRSPEPQRQDVKFDWTEARALRADGLTYTAIGEKLGVSPSAVRRVCDDAVLAQARARNIVTSHERNHSREKTCKCGAEISNNAKTCVDCKHDKAAKTVRKDRLRCYRCGRWRADSKFPHDASRPRRRNRRQTCRECETERKREYRERQKTETTT